MSIQVENYKRIQLFCQQHQATLVAVSKTKPVEDILELYKLGHRDFGENYVQELLEKQAQLPSDIRWHFIGHLQSNKVKYLAPFISLIHGVDSFKLLKEINKQALKTNRIIPCLLQMYIAKEETKFGMDKLELAELLSSEEFSLLSNICVEGLMGMASFSNDKNLVESEFKGLYEIYRTFKSLQTPNCKLSLLSMGMSGDYELAISAGSNMVRIGSLLFGAR